MSIQNPADWPYVDSPWDLLYDCWALTQPGTNASVAVCTSSTILGISSAYILPPVCFSSLVISTFIICALGQRLKRLQRQYVFVLCMTIANVGTNIIFAWLWIIPAKGIPYATNGTSYFFIFYVSPTACSTLRFAYSFTSTTGCNFLLLSSLDRFLTVYFPIKFAKKSKSYAWYASVITVAISAALMIPVPVLTHLSQVGGQLICWFDDQHSFMSYYHTFLSNSAIIQPLLVGILNVLFMLRIFRLTRSAGKQQPSGQDRAYMRSSVMIFVLSTVYIMFAIPQSAAYLCAYSVSHEDNGVNDRARLAYNMADLGWNLYFLRELINTIILIRSLPLVRNWLLNIVSPFSKTTDPTSQNVSKNNSG